MADAIVVGAGPNGLVAAIELARAGLDVLVLEAAHEPGGGVRTAELTLPGFLHDVCSSVYPLAVSAPAMAALPLAEHGLEWVHAPLCCAHPLDDGPAAVLAQSLDETAQRLGSDGQTWRALVEPFVEHWDALAHDILRPLRVPHSPLLAARFGIHALRTATSVASRFRTAQGRALFAGLAAHGMLPLERVGTAAIGMVLAVTAHVAGWPVPRGGARALTDALVAVLRAHGGRIECGVRVHSLDELPPARAVLLDLTATQAAAVAGARLPDNYRRRLERVRPGAAAFKVDYALSEPIPWRDEDCRRAMVVHACGTMADVAAAERAAWPATARGSTDSGFRRVMAQVHRTMRDTRAGAPHSLPRGIRARSTPDNEARARPFLLVSQPSLFDASRAPAGSHAAWAYTHVPRGFTGDITAAMEAQIERFAPGFRECIVERAVLTPAWLERHNPNLTGGDINGGAPDLGQTLFRPTPSWNPYATPVAHLYLCSSSTPPGGGVHGMCGRNAAWTALRRSFGMSVGSA